MESEACGNLKFVEAFSLTILRVHFEFTSSAMPLMCFMMFTSTGIGFLVTVMYFVHGECLMEET